MRIFGGTLATIAVLLIVLWRMYVTAPAPAAVCDHIIEVTLKEAGDQAMTAGTQDTLLERLRQQCIQHKRDKIQFRGKIEYATYAKCVMAASELQAIESC